TIKFNDWHLDVDVYVNGEKYQSFTNSQGLTSITIDADKLGGPTAQITVKTTNMGNIATINLQDCVYTKPAAKSTEHEVVDTVTLNDANDWTKLWTGLAQKDSSGNTYNYVVKELSSTVAAKSVAYSNNDGIQTGTIVVTNTLGDSYELPKTGGSGTSGITLLGVAVALASAGALLARRARKDKGTE
ncbi:MAG: LPXTG cell wall anchor domain-containing protein, partial [Atopobiaceae bacterium]